MRRNIFFVLSLAALAGCGSLPHPFEHDHPLPETSALTLPDGAGLALEPVAGLPQERGRALAQELASALAELDLPAGLGVRNRASFRLAGVVAPDRPNQILWRLSDPAGAPLSEEVEPLGEPVKGAVSTAARATAERIAQRIGATAPATASAPKRQIAVEISDPAGPEAKSALATALSAALAARGFDTQPSPGATPLHVRGELALTPASASDRTHVRLVWHVAGSDRVEAAQLTQENDVPSRDLPRGWGIIAPAVAAATVDDLIAVLNKLQPPV